MLWNRIQILGKVLTWFQWQNKKITLLFSSIIFYQIITWCTIKCIFSEYFCVKSSIVPGSSKMLLWPDDDENHHLWHASQVPFFLNHKLINHWVHISWIFSWKIFHCAWQLQNALVARWESPFMTRVPSSTLIFLAFGFLVHCCITLKCATMG